MAITQPLTHAMVEIVDLAARLGVAQINKLPGCWELQVDAQWWIALNGHSEPTKCSKGAAVPPFHAYVEFNGWPAGVIGCHAGTIAAGAAANEQAFIEAVKGRVA
jgi:hypothetical protein